MHNEMSLGDEGLNIAFIRSTVNTLVSRWRPGDTVTITNGQKWTTYRYTGSAMQLWVPLNFGEGEGRGKLRNPPPDAASTGSAGGGGASRGGGELLPGGSSRGGSTTSVGIVTMGPTILVGQNGGGGGCKSCHNN